MHGSGPDQRELTVNKLLFDCVAVEPDLEDRLMKYYATHECYMKYIEPFTVRQLETWIAITAHLHTMQHACRGGARLHHVTCAVVASISANAFIKGCGKAKKWSG